MATPQISNELLREAHADCISDLIESQYLLDDAKKRLSRFLSDIKKTKQFINTTTYTEMLATAQTYVRVLDHKLDAIKTCIKTLKQSPLSLPFIAQATTLKDSSYEFIRTHETIFGALATSTDWQSPSFDHAVQSQAGRETNTIYATINDYKRDQNWDAHYYERAFAKTNIDAFVKFPIQVLATSSGMAAFTTILTFLTFEHKATRPILMGKSSYFQNRILLQGAFGSNIIEFDETDTASIINAIQTHHPSVIFIDSLTNSPEVALPNLPLIIDYLMNHVTEDTYLVIDNTGLPLMLQPFKMMMGKRTKLRLILFESLNKYHQFGMDRITGGIIASFGGDTPKLFDYRRHAGTNIPDNLASSLPSPNRTILLQRLLRHQRNAMALSSTLQEWIDGNPKSPFAKIVFPGLPNHPSYVWAKTLPFTSSYFVVEFKKKYQTVACYKRFISSVIKHAKRRKVHLVAGSTFGINQTRLYLTSLWSRPSMPFVRIAVGTENRIAIEAVKEIFVKVFCTFR